MRHIRFSLSNDAGKTVSFTIYKQAIDKCIGRIGCLSSPSRVSYIKDDFRIADYTYMDIGCYCKGMYVNDAVCMDTEEEIRRGKMSLIRIFNRYFGEEILTNLNITTILCELSSDVQISHLFTDTGTEFVSGRRVKLRLRKTI